MIDLTVRSSSPSASTLRLSSLMIADLGEISKRLLGRHVRAHRGIAESLGLHDTLHVGGPTELTSTDGTR